jgi:mono/diheme cytochrome c family protein
VARGAALFAPTDQGGFNCAGCHGGMAGTGGQPQYTLTEVVNDANGQPVVDPKTKKAKTKVRQVLWTAPALNTATLRFSDAQLTEVLTYGRPFSPMPAWGIAGGGPMNDQQIQNLIAYLHSIQISPAKAQAAATKAAQAELTRLQGLKATLAQEQAKSPSDPVAIRKLQNEIALNQPATMAAALFNIECARCHTLGWSYGEPGPPGGGAFGPPLANAVNQFPDPADHIAWVTEGKQFGEKYGRQGKASGRMPYFGRQLTPDQIQLIVDYERTLGKRNGAPS